MTTTTSAGGVNTADMPVKDTQTAEPLTSAGDPCAVGRAIIPRPGRRTPAAERMARLVGPQTSGGCLPWIGAQDGHGYGKVRDDAGRLRRAHVLAYELTHGAVPEGHQLDHLCHTASCAGGRTCPHRSCVNVEHLQPVTSRENTLRGAAPTAVNAAKTHCLRGHAFDADNTIRRGTERECRACARDRKATRRAGASR